MNPIQFKEQTNILQRPPSLTDEQCGPLSVFSDGKICISCWKGSWSERFHFLFRGKVWLRVWFGVTQPPVYVGVGYPFKKERRR